MRIVGAVGGPSRLESGAPLEKAPGLFGTEAGQRKAPEDWAHSRTRCAVRRLMRDSYQGGGRAANAGCHFIGITGGGEGRVGG